MATHKSAEKRHRQSEKRRARNHAMKARLRTLVKKVRVALESKDAVGAAAGLGVAARALDRAVSKGIIHRNNAARRISRLSHQVASLPKSA